MLGRKGLFLCALASPGVCARDVDFAIGIEFAAVARLKNCDPARGGVEGHRHQAGAFEAILIGRHLVAVDPGFRHGLGAARPAEIAGDAGILESENIMAAADLPGDGGGEAAELLGGEGLHPMQ